MPSNKMSSKELEDQALKALEKQPENEENNPQEPDKNPEANPEQPIKLDDLLAIDKEDLDDEQIEFIRSNSDKLTDEQKAEYGLKIEEKKTPPPIEDRYKAQQQENQVLYAKTKKINEAVEKASTLPSPDEAELKAIYPDWDEMSNFEKKLATDNLINTKKFNTIFEATQEGRKLDEWRGKIDSFLTKGITDYPALVGKEEVFKAFASKETRRGVDFEDLVSAFLFNEESKPKIKKHGSILEVGSGGGDAKPPSEKITSEQIKKLRTLNQKEYGRLIKSGQINPEEII